MIKGSRQRDETSMAMGQSQINITQCDLKRTIQINDSARKYIITSLLRTKATRQAPAAGMRKALPAQRKGAAS